MLEKFPRQIMSSFNRYATECQVICVRDGNATSSKVYVKQAITSTLLLALVAIVFTSNNVKSISIFIAILHELT